MRDKLKFEIAGREIGPGHPCFIIAEAGVNHNGDVNLAERLVDVAADAGADAVKFQTWKTELVVAPEAPKADYQLLATDASESQFDMEKSLELPPEAFEKLMAHAKERGIIFLSSPFDHESVDFLDRLGVPAFKVPSGELVNLPLLRHIAKKNKPVILSTGMSYLSEVETAVQTLQAGAVPIVVLHCVSNYPTEPSDVNLRVMDTMSQEFNLPVGFSDHTLGVEVALAAVARGACVIEKHFTLDRTMAGPDHRASLEPAELRSMVQGIRTVEAALGRSVKEPSPSEENTMSVARRSLYLWRDALKGTILQESDLVALRPAGGIPPSQFDEVVGKRLQRSLPAGTVLSWDDLS